MNGGNPAQSGTGPEGVLRRYSSALRRLVWSYAARAADREDLFQEIAVALWKALPKFRRDCSERTYVYRVAHNTAISFVTSRQRRAAREQAPGEHDAEPASGADPERDAIDKQRRQRLWNAVQDLPAEKCWRRPKAKEKCPVFSGANWRGGRDSNPRPPA